MSKYGYGTIEDHDNDGEQEGSIYRNPTRAEEAQYRREQREYERKIHKYDRSQDEIERLEREEKRGRYLWNQ